MSKRKEYSIPDCPQISKYDGMGSAGANMMYHDRVAREGHRSGDYTETIEITTTHYHDNGPSQTEQNMAYNQIYRKGYEDACKDIGSSNPIQDSWANGYIVLSKETKERWFEMCNVTKRK